MCKSTTGLPNLWIDCTLSSHMITKNILSLSSVSTKVTDMIGCLSTLLIFVSTQRTFWFVCSSATLASEGIFSSWKRIITLDKLKSWKIKIQCSLVLYFVKKVYWMRIFNGEIWNLIFDVLYIYLTIKIIYFSIRSKVQQKLCHIIMKIVSYFSQVNYYEKFRPWIIISNNIITNIDK